MRHRRIALGIAAAIALAAGIVPAAADDTSDPPPDPDLPRAGCHQNITDPKGDAVPDYVGGGALAAAFSNKPALDILDVFLRLTDDQLQVFVALDGAPNIATMAPYEASYRYIVTFKMAGKTFTYGMELVNAANPAQPLDGSSYPNINMGTGGKDLPGSTAEFMTQPAPAPSYVVFTSPRDRVEKNLGAAIAPGASFTDISAMTQTWTSQLKASVDSTSIAAAKAVHLAGDDACFGPPPTSLGSIAVPATQWSDSARLSAVLLDADGKPLAGKPVNFTVAGSSTPLVATTDAAGRATVSYGPVRLRAGSYPVTIAFDGDDDAKESSATGTLKVAAEKTVFAALQVAKSGTARVVTATLLDDDKHAVAGAGIDWWVNGKKVAHAVTDKKGHAQLRTARAGQTVQARYAGAAGMLLAAVSRTTKA